MGDPFSPQQQAAEALTLPQSRVKTTAARVRTLCGDPETHSQTGRTRDIITGFQTGQPQSEHPRAEETRQD